jgi:hypothetical protein
MGRYHSAAEQSYQSPGFFCSGRPQRRDSLGIDAQKNRRARVRSAEKVGGSRRCPPRGVEIPIPPWLRLLVEPLLGCAPPGEAVPAAVEFCRMASLNLPFSGR